MLTGTIQNLLYRSPTPNFPFKPKTPNSKPMPPVLLLHGALGSAAQLEPLANALQPDFRPLRFDFPGHGGKPLTAPFDLEQFAQATIRWMDEQEIARADVFGYSMGGYVALLAARAFPHRIGRIFTLGTKFDWTPESAARESALLIPEKITEKALAFAATLARRHAPQDWQEVVRATASLLQALGSGKALKVADFQEIKHRVLLTLGELDNMVTVAETQAVARELPSAQFKPLAQTPHPFEKVSHEMLAQEIRSFLSEP